MSTSKQMIESISSIINSANDIIMKMSDKDRMQIKDLAARVAKSTGSDAKQVLDFVAFFARNTDLGYVARGKNGGFIRGEKPVKATPAPAPSVSDSDSDDESDDDSDE